MSTILSTDWPAPAACEALSGVFRHPFHEPNHDWDERIEDRATPANERNMCALSAVLRSKPQWWIKYTDPAVRERWRSEAVGASVPYGEIPLAEDEVDYVLDELAHYAAVRDPLTGIEASIAARIWQSDSLIGDGLRDEFLTCVAKLEDVPDESKDWHPRANGQVLDLVHPSLYPAVYGRTTITAYTSPQEERDIPRPQYTVEPATVDLEYGGKFRLTKDFHAFTTVNSAFISQRFQWLPTDFAISDDGTSARALGYINNVEVRTHSSLSRVLESLVVRFIPLWQRVLGETAAGYIPPARTKGRYIKHYLREQTEEEEDNMEEPPFTFTLPNLRGKFLGHPAPPSVCLNGRTLQVIVKLANIHLKPDTPEYPGGSWHVEGMVNEAIVSTGIYYYDEDNVTESRLAFRTAVDDPGINYEQWDSAGVQATYELDRNEPLVQTLGVIVTKAGRCIAFPNIYQHQVQPFALADPSRPGHRKILALFLVDPSLKHPRPSTTYVPPQQREWMHRTVRSLAASPKSRLSKLPVELLDAIINNIEGLMTRAEADALRLELMDERSVMTWKNTEQVFAAPFNMCEH